nr:glycoside hydrolase family 3 C-terminal domain-containing protein [uncultured Treponema sp.]
MSCSSNVDERTIREIYFPAFEKTVKDGKPDTVMCSYNRINGVFASENKWLLTDVLRKEWGFDGYVVSDWGAVNKRVEGLVAGLDLEMPDSGGTTDRQIVEAVKSGKLKQSVLDKTVERILRIVFKFVDGKTEGNFDKEAHHKLVAEIAKESMVLLKNEKNILPLKEKDAESILFVGEFAKTPRYEGGGSAHINTWKVTSALDAAKACGLKVNYVQGYDVKEKKDKKLLPEAIEASKKAKTVVIFAGLPDSYESEGYDRKDMKMPQNQDVLISEIAKVNKNVVVVLHNGSPVEMPWVNDVKGILESYLAGESVGTAQIDLLFGKANPCGKLAETFPVKTSDNPTFLNFPGNGHDVNYAEGIYIGYRYYDKKEMKVQFPFGHGLSYTTFEYSDLKLSSKNILDTDKLEVSVKVTNTGKVSGKEIVQLYVSELTGTHEDRPVKELKAFTKVQLNPKESKVVTMTLDKRSFAFWNTEIGDWYAPTGEYLISAGASCTDIRLTAKVNVTSTAKGVFKINENTVLEEMLEHPVAAKCAELLVKSFMDEMLGDRSESEKESVSDEMMLAMLRSMPLRALRSFINMKDEEVVKFIEETNKELSK